MKRLYEKDKTLFAVACIVVYVLVCGNLRNLGDDSPAMMAGLAVLSAVLFRFVRGNGLMEWCGMNRWAKESRRMLWLVPLWAISTGNIWGGIEPKYGMPGQLWAVLSFALVGFLEELIFRGLLFRAMLEGGRPAVAVAVSALTFGMGHIVNLLTGHGGLETAVQMVFGVAVGFLFTMVYWKGGSLLPCILSHSLIDVLSVFSKRSETGDRVFLIVALVTCAVYGLWLLQLESGLPQKTESM